MPDLAVLASVLLGLAMLGGVDLPLGFGGSVSPALLALVCVAPSVALIMLSRRQARELLMLQQHLVATTRELARTTEAEQLLGHELRRAERECDAYHGAARKALPR